MTTATQDANFKTDSDAVGIRSTALFALSDRLKARAENAYLEMISAARKDEALGWEIKVERGTFGRPELDAHSAIAEKLGRHSALMEAHNLLAEILEANASVMARLDGGPNT